ncbi:MAG: tRNA (adenosine(37)-N6)-threonylcarbamoyltransferase complex ATPase subunit type 1 TsaE [Phycisphaerae bacterium]|nr:tRNA (adenosine(37)-N6)-threonylcarbamoyltransferase complex ATPase subunit type 1 TsaE [Gemmatimonadaceae bacterium]
MSHFASLDSLLNVGTSREFTLAEMQQWGQSVGERLPARSVITLGGDLGAGKTTLARALCQGLGVLDVSAVTSPTFAIIQEYPTATASVTHADLYRLKGDADLDALGWEEIMESARTLIVEWPERYTRSWPPRCVHITLAFGAAGIDTRVARVTTP